MSRVGAATSIASHRPSGENLGLLKFDSVVLNGDIAPAASSQEMAAPAFAVLETYARMEDSETANCALPTSSSAAPLSVIVSGGPVTARFARSNGTAKSDESWT